MTEPASINPAGTGVTEIELRVRYAETDQMGVVYHANYFVWCEMARTELIRRRFLPYSELEKRGVVLAVAEASMRYLAPARYEDDVRVRTWISEVRSRTVTFDYEIERVGGSDPPIRLATATTRLIGLGVDSRPRTLPRELLDALENG
jgi:acyl-CoA thioester hydrolase